MSAMGHKRTFCDAIGMSALPPKADMCGAISWLAGRSRRLDGADVGELDRPRRRRRLELLRNKPRHA
jgi:hypothetical protein